MSGVDPTVGARPKPADDAPLAELLAYVEAREAALVRPAWTGFAFLKPRGER